MSAHTTLPCPVLSHPASQATSTGQRMAPWRDKGPVLARNVTKYRRYDRPQVRTKPPLAGKCNASQASRNNVEPCACLERSARSTLAQNMAPSSCHGLVCMTMVPRLAHCRFKVPTESAELSHPQGIDVSSCRNNSRRRCTADAKVCAVGQDRALSRRGGTAHTNNAQGRWGAIRVFWRTAQTHACRVGINRASTEQPTSRVMQRTNMLDSLSLMTRLQSRAGASFHAGIELRGGLSSAVVFHTPVGAA